MAPVWTLLCIKDDRPNPWTVALQPLVKTEVLLKYTRDEAYSKRINSSPTNKFLSTNSVTSRIFLRETDHKWCFTRATKTHDFILKLAPHRRQKSWYKGASYTWTSPNRREHKQTSVEANRLSAAGAELVSWTVDVTEAQKRRRFRRDSDRLDSAASVRTAALLVISPLNFSSGSSSINLLFEN